MLEVQVTPIDHSFAFIIKQIKQECPLKSLKNKKKPRNVFSEL